MSKMNLSVVDYLVKPVDKVELEICWRRLQVSLERERKVRPSSQDLDEAGFVSYLGGKENWMAHQGKNKVFHHSLLCIGSRLADFLF